MNLARSEQEVRRRYYVCHFAHYRLEASFSGPRSSQSGTFGLGYLGKEDSEDDYEELEALIKDSVAKRDKKEGTKLLKKAKGKAKISKGEVGGGSFQSMGAWSI